VHEAYQVVIAAQIEVCRFGDLGGVAEGWDGVGGLGVVLQAWDCGDVVGGCKAGEVDDAWSGAFVLSSKYHVEVSVDVVYLGHVGSLRAFQCGGDGMIAFVWLLDVEEAVGADVLEGVWDV